MTQPCSAQKDCSLRMSAWKLLLGEGACPELVEGPANQAIRANVEVALQHKERLDEGQGGGSVPPSLCRSRKKRIRSQALRIPQMTSSAKAKASASTPPE